MVFGTDDQRKMLKFLLIGAGIVLAFNEQLFAFLNFQFFGFPVMKVSVFIAVALWIFAYKIHNNSGV